jgi:hypothetical protein
MIRESFALRAFGIVDVTHGHNMVSLYHGGTTNAFEGFSTKPATT